MVKTMARYAILQNVFSNIDLLLLLFDTLIKKQQQQIFQHMARYELWLPKPVGHFHVNIHIFNF